LGKILSASQYCGRNVLIVKLPKPQKSNKRYARRCCWKF
jgi:hypothetical protein